MGASTSLESLDRLGEPRQAWRARSLAKIRLKSLLGPGRPARGTLVSTVPTERGGTFPEGAMVASHLCFRRSAIVGVFFFSVSFLFLLGVPCAVYPSSDLVYRLIAILI